MTRIGFGGWRVIRCRGENRIQGARIGLVGWIMINGEKMGR